MVHYWSLPLQKREILSFRGNDSFDYLMLRTFIRKWDFTPTKSQDKANTKNSTIKQVRKVSYPLREIFAPNALSFPSKSSYPLSR